MTTPRNKILGIINIQLPGWKYTVSGLRILKKLWIVTSSPIWPDDDLMKKEKTGMNQTIRELLSRHGGLPIAVGEIADDADLYAAGLTSFASVQLMLGLEEAFDLEFPDHLLNRKSFGSIEAIERTIASILENRKVA